PEFALIGDAVGTPVTITVSSTDASLVDTVGELVSSFNAYRDKLDQVTEFNVDTGIGGPLVGDGTARRIEADLSRFITGRFTATPTIGALETLGVSVTDQGQLTFDAAQLQAAFAENPDAVRDFFTDETQGFAARFEAILDGLVDTENSATSNRLDSLQAKVDNFNRRIEFLNERLARSQERLLAQFFNMELVIGRLQNNLAALAQLQILPPLTSTGS
ncbi:unnamed protein product, partial [marine sediment metagenome]